MSKIADSKGITTATEERSERRACLCGQIQVNIDGVESANDLPRNVRRFAEDEGKDDAGWLVLSTGCTQSTSSIFAPGHDARLAGMLQAAHRLGGQVIDGSMATDALPFALSISDAFAAKVAHTPAPKAERKTTGRKAKGRRIAEIKVGRWTYAAEIDAEGTAFWTDAKGNERKTFDGAYTEI